METVLKWRNTISKSLRSRKTPKSLTKITKKKKPTAKRGAKSGFGRDPGRKGTDSSQLLIKNYFCKEEEGSPMGVRKLKDTNASSN